MPRGRPPTSEEAHKPGDQSAEFTGRPSVPYRNRSREREEKEASYRVAELLDPFRKTKRANEARKVLAELSLLLGRSLTRQTQGGETGIVIPIDDLTDLLHVLREARADLVKMSGSETISSLVKSDPPLPAEFEAMTDVVVEAVLSVGHQRDDLPLPDEIRRRAEAFLLDYAADDSGIEEPLGALHHRSRIIGRMTLGLDGLARTAHSRGASWRQIGGALGISPQTAFQRFSEKGRAAHRKAQQRYSAKPGRDGDAEP